MTVKYECDIILLSYESPGLLKKCVESVFKYTRVPVRLIIVDNASKDPAVAEYLNAVESSGNVAVRKLFNDENLGFAAGINEGMKISDSPYVCLLNNDCEVTDGWLREMLLVAESSSEIGIVNPESNTFGSVPAEGVSIHDHAVRLQKNSEKYVEIGHAIGFACLIKREVIDSIGYLDEIYSGVCYEDSDFSIRAQKAGFIPVIAEGAYVFHEEQASRKDLAGKEKIYACNKKIFEDRWGKILRILLLDPESKKTVDVLGYYGALRKLAKERAFLKIWTVSGRPGSRVDDAVKSGILIKHTDIAITVFKRRIKMSDVVLRILTKKKKYNAIFTADIHLARVLRFLKPFHGGEVFTLDDSYEVTTGKSEKLSLYDDAQRIASCLREERG
ncbi:MAG: glycosyltransferase family 2 protein [Candidatus Omnitrophota bacterium]